MILLALVLKRLVLALHVLVVSSNPLLDVYIPKAKCVPLLLYTRVS
jgi:hypothetical protein